MTLNFNAPSGGDNKGSARVGNQNESTFFFCENSFSDSFLNNLFLGALWIGKRVIFYDPLSAVMITISFQERRQLNNASYYFLHIQDYLDHLKQDPERFL